MKKRENSEKELSRSKLRKSSNLSSGKRKRRKKEPDPWKILSAKLKPLGKAYINFREKQKIKKQKEELKRLKEDEKQRLKEQEEQRVREQEDKKIKKERRLKEEEERRLKTQEEKRLKEKKLKEERLKKEREEKIYKERLAKGEEERLKQLMKVNKLREEELELLKLRDTEMKNKIAKEQKIQFGEKQDLRKEEVRTQNTEIKIEEEKLKDEKISPKVEAKKVLSGEVKWFNSSKGYGFIKVENEEKDIFVHHSAVQSSGLKYLKRGDLLTFELENSDKGPSAINLNKVVQEVSRGHLKLVK